MSKTIFLSHSHQPDDQALAKGLQEAILECCAEGTKVFRSSDLHSKQGVMYGEDWYARIDAEVDKADAMVALITPASALKPWILYEAGFARGKKIELQYGLVVPPSSQADLGPLSPMQSALFTKEGMQKVLRELTEFSGARPNAQLERVTNQLMNTVAAPLINIRRSGEKRQEPPPAFLKVSDDLLKSIDFFLNTTKSSQGTPEMIRRWAAAASLCSAAIPWLQPAVAQLWETMLIDDAKGMKLACRELNLALGLVEELTNIQPNQNLEDACSILGEALDRINDSLSPTN